MRLKINICLGNARDYNKQQTTETGQSVQTVIQLWEQSHWRVIFFVKLQLEQSDMVYYHVITQKLL